jgi:hypothetical protein
MEKYEETVTVLQLTLSRFVAQTTSAAELASKTVSEPVLGSIGDCGGLESTTDLGLMQAILSTTLERTNAPAIKAMSLRAVLVCH